MAEKKTQVDKALESVDTQSTVYDDAGVHVGETLESYDALYVGQQYKKEIESKGGKTHWASDRQLQRHKNNGMKSVVRKETDDSMALSSTEDSRVRIGDLTLMEVPERMRLQREKLKRQQVDSTLYARKEQMERMQEGAAKSVYDAAVRKGMSSDQAANLARSAAKGISDGRLDIRRGR